MQEQFLDVLGVAASTWPDITSFRTVQQFATELSRQQTELQSFCALEEVVQQALSENPQNFESIKTAVMALDTSNPWKFEVGAEARLKTLGSRLLQSYLEHWPQYTEAPNVLYRLSLLASQTDDLVMPEGSKLLDSAHRLLTSFMAFCELGSNVKEQCAAQDSRKFVASLRQAHDEYVQMSSRFAMCVVWRSSNMRRTWMLSCSQRRW